MALVKEYISESGAHIRIFDDCAAKTPEEKERIYKNLEALIEKFLTEGKLKLPEFEGVDPARLRARIIRPES